MVENLNGNIGQAVAARRGETSQAAIAEAMRERGHDKWSQSTVWSVETGSRPLRLSEAVDLAGIFECDVNDFLVMSDELWIATDIRKAARAIRQDFAASVEHLTSLTSGHEWLRFDLSVQKEHGWSLDQSTRAEVAEAMKLTPARAQKDGREQSAANLAAIKKGADRG